jgi:hypothetical protein
LAEVRAGRTITVLVHGPSGVGKSALVHHFLECLATQESQTVVLAGRCYERESVPFKALDGLVDALSRFWRRLPRAQAEALLPRDVGPLVRVFPVLLRVEAVADAPRRGPDSPNPHELRRRAFAALREILARVGDRRPLVVHLDDLQWGDMDSAWMLADLLRPPEPPRLLLLASFRSEDRQTSPFLATFLQTPKSGSDAAWRELSVAVLRHAEACDLAGRLLGSDSAAQAAEAVARESGGNPFFIEHLVQAIRAGEPDVTLDKLIWRRVSGLPPGQRRLLEVVAVAGRPLHRAAAVEAAAVGHEGRKSLIELEAARLLRGGPAEQQEVETYHDRVRETVVANLEPAALAEHHHRLAVALETWGKADPEVLAVHCHRAGELVRAGRYYAAAAEQAAKALAFDRAAHLYALALQVSRPTVEEASRLRGRRGEALANAGRGAEAAAVYLEARAGATPATARDLQRRAADQLLRSGRMDEGLNALNEVLQNAGLHLPKTPWRALLTLLICRALKWWHGTRFLERQAGDIPAAELVRLDVCWSAGMVLTMVDTIRGHAFLARHNLLALRAGEPYHVALAQATEAAYLATSGGKAEARAESMLQVAAALVERVGRPYARAVLALMGGVVAMLTGQWRKAGTLTERAADIFRRECTGVAWELSATYHFRFTALQYLGDWNRCATELWPLLREAREHGDLFTATNLLIHSATLHLAADDLGAARLALVDAIKQWPCQGFYLQHYHALTIEAQTALYAGDAVGAWKLVGERWAALRRSYLLRVQYIRMTLLHLRARCAVAAAASSDGRPREQLLNSAERDGRALEREAAPWAGALAQVVRAAAAANRQRLPQALDLLEIAVRGLEAADMLLHAAAARRCRGQLLGGEQGRELVRAADAFMATQGISNPVRLTAMLAPGFPA